MKQEFRVGTKEIRSSAVGTGEKKKNTRKNRRITRKSVRTIIYVSPPRAERMIQSVIAVRVL